VPGNWQARFWRPVERGDPSAEFNGETHRGRQITPPLTLPQVRYGLSLLLLEVFYTPGIDSLCRQVQRQLSSKGAALPSPPPLRTGHICFQISGSSLSEPPCDRGRHTRRI